MKALALLILVFAATIPVMADDDGPKAAATQRDQCRFYLAHATDRLMSGNICEAYTRGVKDEMAGEVSLDANHKPVTGVWRDGVTTDQVVRVFMQYLDKNPAQLNKPAATAIRQSAETSGIYTYSPAQ